jgi:predicted transcriptional regulator
VPKNDIPNEIFEFLVKRIDSIEGLDILMLISGAKKTEWTITEVAEELRSNAESVGPRIRKLVQRKLLVEKKVNPYTTYSFNLTDVDILRLTDQLREIYRVRKYRVMEVILSKPLDVLQTFADAFKIKKDDE